MAEFRYNPLLDDWTIVNGDRQFRPDMPKDYCAFCPGSKQIKEDYTVLKYDNDWPSMMENPPQPDDVATDFYKTAQSFGKAEVILYSSDHNISLWQLPVNHIKKIIQLWKERFIEIKKDKNIKYILPFENKGKEVGTTQIHPHGQIYGYGFLPLRIKLELENSKRFYDENKESLILKIRDEEIKENKRIIIENDSFVAFLPFYTDYPFGVYIAPKLDNIYTFEDFTDKISTDFATILKETLGTFDALYNKPFPYMMGIYQTPVNSKLEEESKKYYNFHVKFFPPLRGENSIKWNASSETAAWAKTNPRKVEETSEELRQAYKKYKENEGK